MKNRINCESLNKKILVKSYAQRKVQVTPIKVNNEDCEYLYLCYSM